MARGSNAAQNAATSAGNLSSSLQSNLSPLYGELAPELGEMAAAPPGINPADMAAMNTSAKQTAGGTQAGATGQGALLGSRTRNAGAGAAAIASAAKTGGQQESNEDLQTQLANQRLKNQQRDTGLTGLENLYSTDVGGSIGSLGQVANNVNANTNDANQSWDWAKYILDPAMAGASQGAGQAFRP